MHFTEFCTFPIRIGSLQPSSIFCDKECSIHKQNNCWRKKNQFHLSISLPCQKYLWWCRNSQKPNQSPWTPWLEFGLCCSKLNKIQRQYKEKLQQYWTNCPRVKIYRITNICKNSFTTSSCLNSSSYSNNHQPTLPWKAVF